MSWSRKLNEQTARRRRWRHRCLGLGGLLILFGICGLNLAHVIYVSRTYPNLVTVLDTVAIAAIVIGGLLISFGPMAGHFLNKRS